MKSVVGMTMMMSAYMKVKHGLQEREQREAKRRAIAAAARRRGASTAARTPQRTPQSHSASTTDLACLLFGPAPHLCSAVTMLFQSSSQLAAQRTGRANLVKCAALSLASCGGDCRRRPGGGSGNATPYLFSHA